GIQEITMNYSGGMPEQETGGINYSFIAREGGNKWSGSFFFNYGDEHWQSNNVDDRLRSLGLNDANSIKRLMDVNPSFGGPIKKDRLWFFGTYRETITENYGAGAYFNKNVPTPLWSFDPYIKQNVASAQQLNTWTYDPDLSRRGFDPGRNR